MKNTQLTDFAVQVIKKIIAPGSRRRSAVSTVTDRAARAAQTHISKLCKSASGLGSLSAVRRLLSDMYAMARNERGMRWTAAQWKLSAQDIGASPLDAVKALFWMAVLLQHGDGLKLNTGFTEHLLFSYYVALQYFLDGNYAEAVRPLKRIIAKYPDHLASRLLLSDAYFAQGDLSHARESLSGLEAHPEAWIRWESHIQSMADFERLQKIYLDAVEAGEIEERAAVPLGCVIDAALRCHNYRQALEFAQHMRELGVQPGADQDCLSPERAGGALRALSAICSSMELQLFIIGRTLLGYIREGGLVSRDTVMEVGVMDNFERDVLQRRLMRSGVFFILPQRCEHRISIRHINGSAIDIYIHYQEECDCWHGGPVVTWHNTPFTLRQIQLQDAALFMPSPPKLYLEEHYGPEYAHTLAYFDAVLECPNARPCSAEELEIYRIIRGQSPA